MEILAVGSSARSVRVMQHPKIWSDLDRGESSSSLGVLVPSFGCLRIQGLPLPRQWRNGAQSVPGCAPDQTWAIRARRGVEKLSGDADKVECSGAGDGDASSWDSGWPTAVPRVPCYGSCAFLYTAVPVCRQRRCAYHQSLQEPVRSAFAVTRSPAPITRQFVAIAAVWNLWSIAGTKRVGADVSPAHPSTGDGGARRLGQDGRGRGDATRDPTGCCRVSGSPAGPFPVDDSRTRPIRTSPPARGAWSRCDAPVLELGQATPSPQGVVLRRVRSWQIRGGELSGHELFAGLSRFVPRVRRTMTPD